MGGVARGCARAVLHCFAGVERWPFTPKPVSPSDSKVYTRLDSPASRRAPLANRYRFRSLVTRSQPITEMGYQLPDDATLARGMARARISDQVGG